MIISKEISGKKKQIKLMLMRLAPIFLLSSIIFTAINSGMAQKSGEGLDDVAWQYAAAISSSYAAIPPPSFTYYSEVHEALSESGFTKEPGLLSNLGITYPENLSQGETLNSAIQIAITKAKSATLDTTKITPMAYTDVGLTIFLTFGIKIFGPSISSALFLLLTLITLSTFMFLITFHNRALDLVALSAALTGCLIWTIYVSRDTTNFELLTIAGMRSISILAIVPALYLALVAIPPQKSSYLAMILAGFQGLILAFAVSLRSSITALLFCILTIIIYFNTFQKTIRSKHKGSQPGRIWSATPMIIVFSFVGMNSLITVLKFVMSRAPNISDGALSYQLPLFSLIAPSLMITLGCTSALILLVAKVCRSSNHSFQLKNSKLVVVIVVSLLLPSALLSLITPFSYYSDDVMPHHVRKLGPLLPLTYSDSKKNLFRKLSEEKIPITFSDATGYAVAFLEYESTLPLGLYVTEPTDHWQTRAIKSGFYSNVTQTWKMRLVDYHAGKAFLRIVQENPIAVAKNFLTKFVSWKHAIDGAITATGLQIHIFVAMIGFFLSGLFAELKGLRSSIKVAITPLLMLIILSIVSFLPIIWAYPLIHTMTDNIIFCLTTILMLCFIIGALIAQIPLKCRQLTKEKVF